MPLSPRFFAFCSMEYSDKARLQDALVNSTLPFLAKVVSPHQYLYRQPFRKQYVIDCKPIHLAG